MSYPVRERAHKSRLIGKKDPVNGSLKGLACARLCVDLNYSPSFSFAFYNGAFLRDGLVAVHIEVDLLRSRIPVIPEYDLLGGFHGLHLRLLDADRNRCGPGGIGQLIPSEGAPGLLVGYSRDSYLSAAGVIRPRVSEFPNAG